MTSRDASGRLQCEIQADLLRNSQCHIVVSLSLKARQFRANAVGSGLQAWKVVGAGFIRHGFRGDARRNVVTVTPGIKAPVASATVPPRVALLVWANVKAEKTSSDASAAVAALCMIVPSTKFKRPKDTSLRALAERIKRNVKTCRDSIGGRRDRQELAQIDANRLGTDT
jgi:hypothetical protein